MPDWRQYEGELVRGEFPLERYLGGSEGRAVFLTRFASGRAAIRLVLADQAQAGELVERWNRAATLVHPHLIRIFESGTGALAGMPLAYLVMEYAEENLAEALDKRRLTTDETREMVEPVAEALAYLHGQGLVHGNLKASNILAVENTVKISSDAVSAGDPAADIWELGVTVVQALTQQAAAVTQDGQDLAVDALPLPFREMAQNCLRGDPRLRWSADKIGSWVRSAEWPGAILHAATAPVARPAAGKVKARYYVASVALVVAGAAIVWNLAMHRTAAPVPTTVVPAAAESVRQTPIPADAGPAPNRQTPLPKAVTPVPPVREAKPAHQMPVAQDGITHRVIPDIPAQARNTVHGTATVVVRVAVDSAGNIAEAKLDPGGSAYFGRLALEAVRHWKFAPVEGSGSRNWILRFQISRTATQVIPIRTGRD